MREMSNYDPNQILRYTFDETSCSNRVSLIGLDNVKINIDTDRLAVSIGEAVGNNLKHLVPLPTGPATEVAQTLLTPVFNVPEAKIVIQKEIERIEVPYIVERTIVQIVEKPVIVEHTTVQVVEKPYIVKEFVEIKQSLPKWVMIVMGIQSLFIAGLMIVK